MSFAGHVFDMIRRNKENREMLNQLRGRTKDAHKNYKSCVPIITVEEFERINMQLKEREQEERRYAFRIKLLAFAVALALLLFILVFFG